ncbi:MAG: Tat pathway signal protein, partial [Asticcacaulis sp. 32-58-5]
GFDTHDGLMEDHPGLMARLDEAMLAFYQATLELGVANQVTTFTASDFGRTLASNGDGTDHGWGGHHFIMGGAVNGRKFYGTAPTVSITDDEQVGQGRLLPTTSVDQFAATLARWFGVSNTELPGVLPNLGNFATSNLGFMV